MPRAPVSLAGGDHCLAPPGSVGRGCLVVKVDVGVELVVPRGVEHCPKATEEAQVVLFEPVGTTNTGDAGGDMTTQLREFG